MSNLDPSHELLGHITNFLVEHIRVYSTVTETSACPTHELIPWWSARQIASPGFQGESLASVFSVTEAGAPESRTWSVYQYLWCPLSNAKSLSGQQCMGSVSCLDCCKDAWTCFLRSNDSTTLFGQTDSPEFLLCFALLCYRSLHTQIP